MDSGSNYDDLFLLLLFFLLSLCVLSWLVSVEIRYFQVVDLVSSEALAKGELFDFLLPKVIVEHRICVGDGVGEVGLLGSLFESERKGQLVEWIGIEFRL